MTVVLVHGLPETEAIWRPLQEVLDRESVAVALPGFAAPRADGFSGTKDALAEWLAATLEGIEPPLDVVGHDIGALLTMRVASAFDAPLRSWAVDVPDIFHPGHVWPERIRRLQEAGREAGSDDPQSMIGRLVSGGVPRELAEEIAAGQDEAIERSTLDFYRSAVPNVAADWWQDAGPTRARGLVLLLPDPPEIEELSIAVAERLGAETAQLDGLNHCWMAEAPERVAPVLERFWASLDDN